MTRWKGTINIFPSVLLPGGWSAEFHCHVGPMWLSLPCHAHIDPLHTHQTPWSGSSRFAGLSSDPILPSFLNGVAGGWGGGGADILHLLISCLIQRDSALPSVILLRQEGWTRWPTEVPSNPYHSVILWKFGSWTDAKIGAAFLKIWPLVTCSSENEETLAFLGGIQLTD